MTAIRSEDLLRRFAASSVSLTGAASIPAGNLTLWYRQPAREWVQALPIGNGRLGAMVFGGVHLERIQLNEETVWVGHREDTTNPDALEYLPEVRRLLFEGKNREAETLAAEHLMGNPKRVQPYQPLGDLWLEFAGHDAVADYRRELDLDTAVARVQYRMGAAHYTREVFASAADQALVMRLACDQPGQLSVGLRMTREQEAEGFADGADCLILRGQLHSKGKSGDMVAGLRFESHLQVCPEGGTLLASSRVMPRRSAYCRPCPTHGRTAGSADCGPEEGTKWISSGPEGA